MKRMFQRNSCYFKIAKIHKLIQLKREVANYENQRSKKMAISRTELEKESFTYLSQS